MKLVYELLQFAIENKKWWLIPFFILILIISTLLYLGSGTVVAPFVYTIF